MEEGQRQVWQMQSALPAAPAHKITVKGQDAMPTGQTGGAGAAGQPEWLVHIEAEPGLGVEKRCKEWQRATSHHHHCWNLPRPPSCGPSSITVLTQQIKKRQK